LKLYQKVIEYFYPQVQSTQALGIDELELKLKIKLLISLNIFVTIIIFSIFVIRLTIIPEESKTLFLLPLACVVFIYSNFYIRKTGNTDVSAYLLYGISLLIIPIRIYYSGGVYSPNFSYFIALIVVASVLSDLKTTIMIFFLSFVGLLILHYTPSKLFYIQSGIRLYIHITAWLTSLWFMIMFMNVRKDLLEKYRENEKVKSLFHQIKFFLRRTYEPMHGLKVTLNKMKVNCDNSKDLELFEHVEISLDRIQGVMDHISEIKTANNFYEEDYTARTNTMFSGMKNN